MKCSCYFYHACACADGFDGAISVGNLPRPPNRQFEFQGFMCSSRGIYKELSKNGQKPPTYFHPYQWENFRLGEGNLTINLGGIPRHLTPESGVIVVAPCTHHVVYGTPGMERNEVEFVIRASDNKVNNPVVLNKAFFENWYVGTSKMFSSKGKTRLIQMLSVCFSQELAIS